MTRHPADLLSLVAGLAVLGLGLVLLAGGVGDIPLEWVGPVVAIGLGVVIALAGRPARRPNQDEPGSTAEA